MAKKTVRLRLAPSPTGFMHIGTLRTALYDWLFVKQNNGKFILRIEDTDKSRQVDGAIENIVNILEWAGLDFDEGPIIQSERLEIYKSHVDKLLTDNKAYWCECTKKELESKKDNHGYDGTCRDKELLQGSVVRLKVPEKGHTQFVDLIRGEVSIPNNEIDDQIILKSDGFPTYHLAVVVDDHLMEISHIFRGEEWISSTPKHVLLYKAFSWDPPLFAHLPLLLNKDKTKLSKRHGDVAVQDFIDKGYLPQALLNFISLQGWNPKADQEVYSLDELIHLFDITKVNKSGAVVNFEKLDWLNSHYISEMDIKELSKCIKPFIHRKVDNEMLEKLALLIQDRLSVLSDAHDMTAFVFELPEYDSEILIWKKSDKEKTLETLKALQDYFATHGNNLLKDPDQLEINIKKWIKSRNYSNGEVLWPLRVALSGNKNSPPPFIIAHILKRDEVNNRLKYAIDKLT